jgi:glycosyltransferase involved in cell wall biosynthesis
MKVIYFWCDSVTPHWLSTLSSLSIELNCAVHIYSDTTALLEDRKVLGWSAVGNYNGVLFCEKKIELLSGIEDFKHGFHLVLNPFNNSFHKALLVRFRALGITYGLQQSTPGLISTRLGRFFRRFGYGLLFGKFLDSASFVLCHGEMCRDYLTRTGVSAEKLFLSGYFVPRVEGLSPRLPRNEGQALKVIYLGQFIERKAVLPLAQAVISQCRGLNMQLDFAGAGPQKEQLMALYENGPGRVLPLVNYTEVIPFLRQYDVLVLPSRADEWAVVVNEAIHAGCAVIVTDKCGAADLVKHGRCGVVVKGWAGCVDALVELTLNPCFVSQWQAASERLSALLTPESGAKYLARLITNAQENVNSRGVTAPWLSRAAEGDYVVV